MSGIAHSTSIPAGAQTAGSSFGKIRKPTRTPATEDAYLARAEKLLLRATKGGHGNFGPLTCTAYFLLANRMSWSPNTWRQYRAAFHFACGTVDSDDARNAVELLDRTVGSPSEKPLRNGKRNELKTSAMRSKTVSKSQLNLLVEAINKSKARTDTKQILMNWILYGFYTGLRPCEWGKARVKSVGGKACLVVVNAKNTNGRAHGYNRTIPLQQLPEDKLRRINDFCENMRALQNTGRYKTIYGTCSKLLSEINKRVLKARRKITLYSMRHGFASMIKVNCNHSEVAALMGHATDLTATSHYGKKRHGGGGLPIKPLAAEVARVRRKHRPFVPSASRAPGPSPARQRPKPKP